MNPGNPQHWRQVEELYHSALEREPGERASFLAEACFGDEELRREVEALLQQGAGPTFTRLRGSMRAQLAAGFQLGQYRIEAILGAGGMGVVYRASDSKLGRQVAIKVLPKAYCEDPERLARFEHEARMLAALDHPNIGAIHGLEEAGGIRLSGAATGSRRNPRSQAGCRTVGDRTSAAPLRPGRRGARIRA